MTSYIQEYNLIAAIVLLVVAAIALIHERHSRSWSRYLLIIIVTLTLVNLASAIDPFLQPDQYDLVRFVRAALRTVVFILLLGGYILYRRGLMP